MGVFITNVSGGIHYITVPDTVVPAEIEHTRHELPFWLRKADLHILDFKDVKKFNRQIFPLVSNFRNLVRSEGKFLFTINLLRDIRSDLSTDGMLDTFLPVKSVQEAKQRANFADQTRRIDVNFINPFIAATSTALKIQANIDSETMKPRLHNPTEPLEIGIAGVIHLKSPGFTGSISLCFPTEVFLQIYEILMGEKHASITKEIEDFAGEFLNIIYGQAKLKLNEEQKFALPQVIPEILVGDNLSQLSRSKTTVVLPFKTSVGEFRIEIKAS